MKFQEISRNLKNLHKIATHFHLRPWLNLLILFLLESMTAKAQGPFGIPYFTTCYQQFDGNIDNEVTYNLLRPDSGTSIGIGLNSTNPIDINNFEIVGKKGESLYYYYGNYSVDSVFWFNDSLDLDTLIITPIPNAWIFMSVYPTKLVLVEPEVTIHSLQFNSQTNQTDSSSCTRFGDQLYFEINLDGLCHDPIYRFKHPPRLINLHGLPINWQSQDFSPWMGSTFNIPNGSDYCEEPTGGSSGIRCYPFTLEIELIPCNEACPPKLIQKEVEICCECEELIGNH